MRLFFIFVMMLPLIALAQKKAFCFSSQLKWPIIERVKISNDGHFIVYRLRGMDSLPGLEIINVDGTILARMSGISSNYDFTADSKRVVFRKANDSLFIFDCLERKIIPIGRVNRYMLKSNENGEFLFFKEPGPDGELGILKVATMSRKYFSHVSDYIVSGNGNAVVLYSRDTVDGEMVPRLNWVDLNTGASKLIIGGQEYSKIKFAPDNNAIAFIATGKTASGGTNRSLLYFQKDRDTATILYADSAGSISGMKLSETAQNFTFLGHGSNEILFYLEPEHGKPDIAGNGNGQLSISFYKNELYEYNNGSDNQLVKVSYNQKHQGAVRLLGDGERVFGVGRLPGSNNDQYGLFLSGGKFDASYRGIFQAPDLWVIAYRTGQRQLLKRNYVGSDEGFSPQLKYVIWYDHSNSQWYTFDIAHKIVRNISSKINDVWDADRNGYNVSSPRGIVGWLKDDSAVLIYSRFDIWKIDPACRLAPINLTRGMGKREKLIFSQPEMAPGSEADYFSLDDTIILSAFDLKDKSTGFFRLGTNGDGHLEKLIMDPKIYGKPSFNIELSTGDEGIGPMKAKNATVYTLTIMTSRHFPNLFTTTDFRSFKQATFFEPEKEYNWYGSELIHWKNVDGRNAEGLLFKPENFDSTKKYPVIFYYYEKCANELNSFINPEIGGVTINIPAYVSNGYIIFVPDIAFRLGYPGPSACNTIVSAAGYLAKQKWVDKNRMGLEGHSFGGYETNYIISHTSLFAAAEAGSGVVDIFSSFGESIAAQSYFVDHQGRLGASLWSNPDLYLLNSPIFRADKVTTPLLILHNVKDHVNSFAQAREWYSALLSLKKTVWLISYANGDHSLPADSKESLDFAIRLRQFFDHYLKGQPAPAWMTDGGPMERKVLDGLLNDNHQ